MFLALKPYAQLSISKAWDKRYGGNDADVFSSVLETNHNGYLLIGSAYSGVGGDKSEPNWDSTLESPDIWLVKLDSNGQKQWDRRFGGTDIDAATCGLQTSDGGYLIGGKTGSLANGDVTDPPRGNYDFWVLKLDSLGNKLWDKRYGGSQEDELVSMVSATNGDYILAGTSLSGQSGDKTQPSRGAEDYWLLRIDNSGNKIWDKRFGGSKVEFCSKVVRADATNFIVGGISLSKVDGDKTCPNPSSNPSFGDVYNYWLVKFDSAGNKIWDKTLGSNGGVYLYGLENAGNNEFVLAGSSGAGPSDDKTDTSRGLLDFWIIKIDSVGNRIWDRTYGGGDDDEGRTICQTQDKGYLICGNTLSQAGGDKSENNLAPRQIWLVKTDSLGNKEWEKTILMNGNAVQGVAIQNSAGAYVVCNVNNAGIGGYKSENAWNGSGDYWIMEFDVSTVDVREVNNELNIRVYPNPFNSYLTIDFPKLNSERANFFLYNVVGELVFSCSLSEIANNRNYSVDLSHLPGAVYFAEVRTANKIFKTKVFKE